MSVLHTIATPAPVVGAGNVHPRTDRRCSPRLQRKFVSQMTPWAPGVASVPFEVVIEDISDTGVGLVYSYPLPLGMRYQLAVPLDDQKQVIREFVVMRCYRRSDGNYSIGVQQSVAPPSADEDPAPPRRVCSSRTKLLFLLFGIFGLIIAIFAPL